MERLTIALLLMAVVVALTAGQLTGQTNTNTGMNFPWWMMWGDWNPWMLWMMNSFNNPMMGGQNPWLQMYALNRWN